MLCGRLLSVISAALSLFAFCSGFCRTVALLLAADSGSPVTVCESICCKIPCNCDWKHLQKLWLVLQRSYTASCEFCSCQFPTQILIQIKTTGSISFAHPLPAVWDSSMFDLIRQPYFIWNMRHCKWKCLTMAGPVYFNCHHNAVNIETYYKQTFIKVFCELA